MKSQTTKPTVHGHYWMRAYFKLVTTGRKRWEAPEIVHVCNDRKKSRNPKMPDILTLTVFGSNWKEPISRIPDDYQWEGPIIHSFDMTEILIPDVEERYGPYVLNCPKCSRVVSTEPAEKVPDQQLRYFPCCEVVEFYEPLKTTDLTEFEQSYLDQLVYYYAKRELRGNKHTPALTDNYLSNVLNETILKDKVSVDQLHNLIRIQMRKGIK